MRKQAIETVQRLREAIARWLEEFKSPTQIGDFIISMDELPPLGDFNTAPNVLEVVLGAYGCRPTNGHVQGYRQGKDLNIGKGGDHGCFTA